MKIPDSANYNIIIQNLGEGVGRGGRRGNIVQERHSAKLDVLLIKSTKTIVRIVASYYNKIAKRK